MMELYVHLQMSTSASDDVSRVTRTIRLNQAMPTFINNGCPQAQKLP